MNMSNANEQRRIESREDAQDFLDRLMYAIENGSATIRFQKSRQVDNKRNKKYTNRYTVSKLFPDEDETEALKRELSSLRIEEYIETVKDTRFRNRSELRIFGRRYSGADVYIKIRVELLSLYQAGGGSFILVISFHFSEREFAESDFPYKER